MVDNKLEDAYTAKLKRDLSKQTDDIYSALVEHHKHSQVPEDLFKEYFLPYFTENKSISDQPDIIAKWIGIAGTPMSEVDVVDMAGDVLFTVPSLFDSAIINATDRKAGNSLADISSEFDLKSNNIPVVAQNFLNNELRQKLSIVDTKQANPKAREQWAAIFDRYGIVNIAPPSVEADDLSDDVEYD